MARTLLNLDEKLLRRAMRLTGIKKKVRVVHAALEMLVGQKEQEKMLQYEGKVHWEGDLREMRRDRRRLVRMDRFLSKRKQPRKRTPQRRSPKL